MKEESGAFLMPVTKKIKDQSDIKNASVIIEIISLISKVDLKSPQAIANKESFNDNNGKRIYL